ncbi:MAG: TfoX/Sxy family protein [Woeseiaceae bacterium]|nr:TfoX/Sxy family protein [Woeseiaceae bacterium]
MAYDEILSAQFRDWLRRRSGISEKRMMGGVCFFLNGNMIGGADRTKEGVGRYMFRLGKDRHALGESLPGAEPMVHGGRFMRGLFFVREGCCDEEELKIWLRHALEHAESLPPK